jgi:hypothetical protein
MTAATTPVLEFRLPGIICIVCGRRGSRRVRPAAAGLIRDDIDIADVIDIAAAIAWVGEQPERDAGQRDRLLRVVVDGLRPAAAANSSY